MPPTQAEARLQAVARRWHDLAESRLAYFNELYRSGRWQRYYSKEHFALRMLDVIKAAKTWRELAGRAQPVGKVLPAGRAPVGRPTRRDDDLRPAA